jgi:DNA polymerase III delta subunit
MLYVFHGDPRAVIEKVEGTIVALLAKSPEASLVRVDEERVATLGDVLFEQGLFKSTYIVYINALSSEILRDYIFENLAVLKESPHLILLGLPAAKNKTEEKDFAELEKVATKVQKCTTTPEMRSENGEVSKGYSGVAGTNLLIKRDPFAISDALLTKDGKRLFVELEHARLSGERGEEVLGVLFWAAKTMLLATGTKNSAEAGLKDYPYRKALGGVTVWGESGARELVYTLATAQTESYRTGEDIYARLERVLCG